MSDLELDISKMLASYSEEVQKDMEKTISKVAKETAKKLREISPKKTGNYAKSWKVKKEGKSYIVHNEDYSYITHLLEHGHAKVNGGRVAGIPHISTAENWAEQKLKEELERSLND